MLRAVGNSLLTYSTIAVRIKKRIKINNNMNISERVLDTISKISKETNKPEDLVDWHQIAIRLAIDINKLTDKKL